METIKQHLKSRHLDSSLYRTFIDEEDRVVTWPLYHLSGQIVGKLQYRPDCDKVLPNHEGLGRYYTILTDGMRAPWGIETLHQKSSVLFVTEGIFDACRFHNYGYAAVAVYQNHPVSLINFFKLIQSSGTTVIGVCDYDKNRAGDLLARTTPFSISTNPNGDCGDMTELAFKDFLFTCIEKFNICEGEKC